jgi:WD40 repeat protein
VVVQRLQLLELLEAPAALHILEALHVGSRLGWERQRSPGADERGLMTLTLESGHQDMVHDAQLDYYGRRLATCSSDRTVKVFDIVGDQQTHLADLRGHEGPVWQVCWGHPKFGSVLASCSFDHRVIIWKESQGNQWQQVRARFADSGSARLHSGALPP